MDKRAQKRFDREHRKRESGGPPSGNSSNWVFHTAEWGGLTVSVMPRSFQGQVYDSNTGVVVGAPPHFASLRACVVVNDGNASNCDAPPLNEIITGKPSKSWHINGLHAYTLPNHIVTEDEKNDAFKSAVNVIKQGRGLTQEEAEAEAYQLIWCSYSVQCVVCKLLVPGKNTADIITQIRQYGWRMWKDKKGFCCRAHIREDSLPLLTDEEFAELEKQNL